MRLEEEAETWIGSEDAGISVKDSNYPDFEVCMCWGSGGKCYYLSV